MIITQSLLADDVVPRMGRLVRLILGARTKDARSQHATLLFCILDALEYPSTTHRYTLKVGVNEREMIHTDDLKRAYDGMVWTKQDGTPAFVWDNLLQCTVEPEHYEQWLPSPLSPQVDPPCTHSGMCTCERRF